ncbi:hypothetical protein C8R45DRAFT_1135013 [Mycena sanguinolenta]|nr:hypothetical protein C8R45DRAFT_1135013 [Mycena sanguinolenta]
MFSKTLSLVCVAAATVQAAVIARQNGPPPPPVFTATRVYQTITDVPPYIVTATTTVIWTSTIYRVCDYHRASPTTTIAQPTGPGLPAWEFILKIAAVAVCYIQLWNFNLLFGCKLLRQVRKIGKRSCQAGLLTSQPFVNAMTQFYESFNSSIEIFCHAFHDLTAPLLFATFRFHPGVYGETSASGTRLRWELDRLSFWSSDAIAPLVRKCSIWLYCTSITTDSIESSTLGTAAFEAVSRFKCLRFLSCNFGNYKVDFTGLRVEELADLQGIRINAGILASPHDPGEPTLKIRHFAYTEIPHLPLSRPPCISLLDPTRLCSLELSYFHPHGLEHFLGDSIAMAPFHNLRTLYITFRDTDLMHIHAAIAPFPRVRELIVHINGSCSTEVVPTTPLAPHLESYRGPAVLLPLVLADSAPDKLIITQGSATQVLEALRAAMHPEFVTSLSIGVKLDPDIRQSNVLQDIFRLCPNLSRTTLEISSDGIPVTTYEGVTIPQILVEVCMSLKALEILVLQWRLGSATSIVPRKSELKALLRSRLPALRHVFFADMFGLLRYE